MAESIEELTKKRDELDRRIKELQGSNGRFKIKHSHHPTHDEEYRAFRNGKEAEKFDLYTLVIKYQPKYFPDSMPIWEPLFAARSRDEVLSEIPQIISDLNGALNALLKDYEEE